MRKIDLAGDWSVRKAGAKKNMPAVVPGCVHADLFAAAEIENPFLRENLKSAAWVADCEWIYEKTFVGEDFSAFDSLILRFDGLSAGATVSLNDAELGRTTNVFEVSEFEVKPLVKVGKNKLTVAFASPFSVQRDPHCRTQASVAGYAGQPVSPTAGIWRGVSLVAFAGVRVTDVLVRQDFGVSGGVGLNVSVGARRMGLETHLEVLVRVCYKGNILHEAREILGAEQTALHLVIKNPQLWWPVGLGDQPLYEVTVDVLSGRTCLEHVSRRIGLRQFSAARVTENGKEVWKFTVNRHPMVLKGSSWLPSDLYVARATRVEYARLVKAAAVANMNVLRVWGGGVYESDAFYDLCDEYGICVWQDMMLCEANASEASPEHVDAFACEAKQNIGRLRHHPSLLLWCAGDPGTRGLDAAFERCAAEQVASADPDRICLPAQPHVPFSLGGNPTYRSLPSFPEPHVVAGYLGEDERNAVHPVCMYHVTPAVGVRQIYDGFLATFLLPSGFDNSVWLSQIQQGFGFKRYVEETRMGSSDMPSGFVYWCLNDCWPACSPSSVDFEGRWKALHYMARRFFASLWLCGGYRAESGVVEIHTFNDGVKPFKGEVQWRLTEMEGTIVLEGSKKVNMAPASHERPASAKVAETLRKHGANNLLMWIYLLDEQGNQVAWNYVLFCPPRELALLPPRMRAEIRNWDENSFAVTLTSHHPALWVWITLDGMDARFDDNFFMLEPEKPFRVRITPASRIKLDQFRQIIRIGSLRDTWQDKRTLMQMMAPAKKK